MGAVRWNAGLPRAVVRGVWHDLPVTGRTVELLAGVPLLAPAEEAELTRLAEASWRRRVSRGQVLFTEGEPSDTLVVVDSGRLKVVREGAQGEQLLLATAGPGEAVGELSVLDGGPRSAGVSALEDSVLVVVPASAVLALLDRSPAVVRAVAMDLAATVRRLTGSSADLVFLDLPRRVAKLVLDTVGERGTGDLRMSQGEIAARLGVTRQSYNRALGGLLKRGWLVTDGSAVHVLDRAALQRFAES